MPLYEYRCTKCGHQVEVLQKLSDRPLRRCKECSGKVEKLVSRTSFQLKGGGWFNQGYGGSKSGGPASAKAAGEAKPKSDSKPAGDAKPTGGGPKKASSGS